MIGAAMKSMDSSLEEGARVLGAGRLRVILTVTLPMVLPGVLSATVFVFGRNAGRLRGGLRARHPRPFLRHHDGDLGSDLVLPRPITAGPPRWACRCRWRLMATLAIARLLARRGSFATISGKAFRPRPVAMGRGGWVLLVVCWGYVAVSVILPLAVLLLTSFQKFATVMLRDSQFTLANYASALQMGTLGQAFRNSLVLGFSVATLGVLITFALAWIVHRSRTPGRVLFEYVAMFPQAVPRLVFGLGLLWAWINLPIPIYGTLWLLGIAYITVFLPLGMRTLAGGDAAGRPQPGGMRAGLRRALAAPHAHHHHAAAAAGPGGGLAAAVHRQRAGIGRVDLPDGPELQSDRTGNRQFLAQLQLGAVVGHGAAADGDGVAAMLVLFAAMRQVSGARQ